MTLSSFCKHPGDTFIEKNSCLIFDLFSPTGEMRRQMEFYRRRGLAPPNQNGACNKQKLKIIKIDLEKHALCRGYHILHEKEDRIFVIQQFTCSLLVLVNACL